MDYEAEVERLSVMSPERIYDVWNTGALNENSLFGNIKCLGCCLTEAKYSSHYHTSPVADNLVEMIRADDRIPNPLDTETIDPSVLPVFQEWQERIDREFPEMR